MTDTAITVIGVGDILMRREQPETIFKHVVDIMRGADITFANLEQMLSGTGHPNPIHATDSDPRNIPALEHAGIDVLSLANNHTMDWGAPGLLDTIELLKKTSIKFVGAGPDIDAAREPVIFEKKGQTVGFLAYSCTGPKGYEADVGRPGYAPVRIHTVYEQWDYQPATPPNVLSMPHQGDLEAMQRDIQALKQRCDVVIVSIHWGQHHVPRIIPDYCFTVGRSAVDAGADLILGAHPHILKGIEVYKGKTIFYGTNNFAFDTKKSVWHRKWLEGYGYTPNPDFPTYHHHPEAFRTLMAKIVVDGGQIQQVSYIPCYVTGTGPAPHVSAEPEPVPASDPRAQEVFDYVKDISESEGLSATFEWQGDEVLILPGPPERSATMAADRPHRMDGNLRFRTPTYAEDVLESYNKGARP